MLDMIMRIYLKPKTDANICGAELFSVHVHMYTYYVKTYTKKYCVTAASILKSVNQLASKAINPRHLCNNCIAV